MSQRASSSFEVDADELFRYVVRNNYKAVKTILNKYPHAANTLYQNKTLLDYPCRYGNKQMVSLLIECGVQVNNYNMIGSPPLVNAIIYNQFQIVKILIQHNAKLEGITLHDNLTVIDYPILHGKYNIATYIYALVADKTLKPLEYYQTVAKKYNIRYINYAMLIEGLKAGKPESQVGDYLTKPKTEQNPKLKTQPQQFSDQEDCCFCCFRVRSAKQPAKEKPKSENNPQTQRKILKKS